MLRRLEARDPHYRIRFDQILSHIALETSTRQWAGVDAYMLSLIMQLTENSRRGVDPSRLHAENPAAIQARDAVKQGPSDRLVIDGNSGPLVLFRLGDPTAHWVNWRDIVMTQPSTTERRWSHQVSVSAVVPVYAGESYLHRLVAELAKVRDGWRLAGAPLELAELILVDDCGSAGSGVLVDELAGAHPWVRALHLAHNVGQHPATIAGILYSAGDWIVTLDEDLQHPPEKIPELLETAVRTKSDVVYARPESSVHQAYSRDIGSRAFKQLVAWLSGNRDVVHFNSFRLIRGTVARAAASVCSHDTFFDVVLMWYTQSISTVAMKLKDERFIHTRKSGYRIRSLVSHARRLVFTGQMKILRLGALLGFGVMILSGLASVTVIALKIFYPESIALAGWTSLILAIGFFGGLNALMLGLLIEYVSALVLHTHGKPLFFAIDRSSDDILADYFKA